ncbi:hypothetical protein BC828DRAFT_389882 [Blastocladiella britannica]|nr:hypothetical protein BC828DRAFT_389882 [Blastocladiella britannica]
MSTRLYLTIIPDAPAHARASPGGESRARVVLVIPAAILSRGTIADLEQHVGERFELPTAVRLYLPAMGSGGEEFLIDSDDKVSVVLGPGDHVIARYAPEHVAVSGRGKRRFSHALDRRGEDDSDGDLVAARQPKRARIASVAAFNANDDDDDNEEDEVMDDRMTAKIASTVATVVADQLARIVGVPVSRLRDYEVELPGVLPESDDSSDDDDDASSGEAESADGVEEDDSEDSECDGCGHHHNGIESYSEGEAEDSDSDSSVDSSNNVEKADFADIAVEYDADPFEDRSDPFDDDESDDSDDEDEDQDDSDFHPAAQIGIILSGDEDEDWHDHEGEDEGAHAGAAAGALSSDEETTTIISAYDELLKRLQPVGETKVDESSAESSSSSSSSDDDAPAELPVRGSSPARSPSPAPASPPRAKVPSPAKAASSRRLASPPPPPPAKAVSAQAPNMIISVSAVDCTKFPAKSIKPTAARRVLLDATPIAGAAATAAPAAASEGAEHRKKTRRGSRGKGGARGDQDGTAGDHDRSRNGTADGLADDELSSYAPSMVAAAHGAADENADPVDVEVDYTLCAPLTLEMAGLMPPGTQIAFKQHELSGECTPIVSDYRLYTVVEASGDGSNVTVLPMGSSEDAAAGDDAAANDQQMHQEQTLTETDGDGWVLDYEEGEEVEDDLHEPKLKGLARFALDEDATSPSKKEVSFGEMIAPVIVEWGSGSSDE